LSEILVGELERIVYLNEEDNYTVARLKTEGRLEPVTVVGNFYANPGETLRLEGEWINHPRFGRQFKVSHYASIVPATVSGIRKYLASGLIKGIGPVFAGRIVERFGKDTLQVIDREIDRLQEVPGIGRKRLRAISQAWQEQREIKEVMVFLQDHGVSPSYSIKIYQEYGHKAIEVVRRNPYVLATDIRGIGFKTADKIAQKLGIPPQSIVRAEAGLRYMLNQLADAGHVYYPREELLAECQRELGIEPEILAQGLEKLRERKEVVVEEWDKNSEAKQGPGATALSRADREEAVYLAAFHTAEVGVARRLKLIRETPFSLRRIDADLAVDWVERRLELNLAEEQRRAVAGVAEHKLVVITGGPGTGKTTIVKAIIEIYRQLQARILLAAPTGRAAKRLAEATGREAKTIHRLLEYNPAQGGFLRHQDNPLPADLVIIDEASMIDSVLMYHLVKAVPPEAKLVLVGDVDQLPSVGAGSVLREVIDSGYPYVVRLREIFRQARESQIVVNAHLINQGCFPRLSSGPRSDFYFIQAETPEKVLEEIKSLYARQLPQRFGLDPLEDIQVLTPTKRGPLGTGNLNRELQQLVNPRGEEVVRAGRVFRVQDKVMQTSNNYEKEVYNGDVGRIVRIDAENQVVVVRMDMGEVCYDFSELDELVPAYAISVHKSQGSEYPAVILPLVTQHYVLLQRNLIYTALTRAKRLAVLVGTKKALAIAIRNNKIEGRFTHLGDRLRRLAASGKEGEDGRI